MAGYFVGTGYYGSKILTNSGGQDVFVAKVSSTGVYLRVTQGGGIATDMAYGVAVDSGGNSYVAGTFAQTGYFGSIKLSSAGGSSFLAKLSSTGAYIRATQ